MKHKLSSLILSVICCAAMAQTTVQSYRPGVTTDGVVYYLPQTELKITVTATRTTLHPGDFHNYAQRFMRINDATHKEQTQWRIDKVQMTAYGAPDTAKAHIVMLKKNTGYTQSEPFRRLQDDVRRFLDGYNHIAQT